MEAIQCRGMIVDDLTGAMDAGVQLVKHGVCVRVALQAGGLQSLADGAAIVIVNTESRGMPPA